MKKETKNLLIKERAADGYVGLIFHKNVKQILPRPFFHFPYFLRIILAKLLVMFN